MNNFKVPGQEPLTMKRAGITFLILSLLIASACKVNYSFTGASVSPNVKTISIHYFPNNASMVVPTLSRVFTDALRDYFTSQTNLVLVDNNGDLDIEGSITGYSVQPISIQGNETAASNRLTIIVKVNFSNKTNEKQNFKDITFSRYLDYPSSQSLNTIQDQYISEISDQLIQDIFNKTVVNW